MDTNKLVEEYINDSTWRTKSNANHNRSHSGLQSHISGTILAKYAIEKFGKIGKRHLDGNYHLHNLEGSVHGIYCNGNDLLNLLQKGLHNPGGISSKPAKHFSTAIDHIVNFTYIMTGEFQGAQAWRDFDVLLAPYVYYDELEYEEVKQEIQEMIWSFSFPMRPAFQTPFVNLTFGLKPSKYYQNLPVIIPGKSEIQGGYERFQPEIDMINNAFLEIMIDSPDGKHPFTFPLPTYNLTKDFQWDSEISNMIFELAAKWGTPYFANYINSDMTVEDALSMCCRLRLNLKEVQRVSGGIWNLGANTGSLAVFTPNLARIGYLSNGNESKFYRHLNSILEDGRDYLLQKKKEILNGMKIGLFPMTKEYIDGKLGKTYFLTIGNNGLNECSLNFCGKDIIENADWCEKVLIHMKEKTLQFQQETGELFNFEATPGEGCSYSLARLDREKFPDIITQGTDEAPYYTGSSLIPMSMNVDLLTAIKHQERMQRHYTGGTVFHIDTGEMSSADAIKDLIQNVCTNTKLPYVTWSPSYTSCPDHGRSGGKERCCEKGINYSRVVGYYRPTERWNRGKLEEFKNKKFYFMNIAKNEFLNGDNPEDIKKAIELGLIKQ